MYGSDMDFLAENTKDYFTAFDSDEVRSDALHDGQAAAAGQAKTFALATGAVLS